MRKKRLAILICGMLAVLFIGFLYCNRENVYQSPFMDCYRFETVSEVVPCSNGNTYVIDNGKKSVIVLDKERCLVRKLTGGSISADFFYASRVCGDEQGNIYIADTISGEQGNRIRSERIIKIANQKRSILYEVDYTESEKPPLQYGNILELQEYKGDVYFLQKEFEGIALYRILDNEKAERIEKLAEIPCTYYMNAASYDVVTETIVITTRLGEIYQYKMDLKEWELIPKYVQNQIPWDVTAINGDVYYTDLYLNGVCHFFINKPEDIEQIYNSENVLYSLAISNDGKMITATDNIQFGYINALDYAFKQCKEVKVGNYFKVLLFWMLLVVIVLVEVFIVIYIIVKTMKALSGKSGASRIALVVCSSVLVAVIASYSSISGLMENNDALVVNNMRIFAKSLRQQIDGEEIKGLNNLSSYHSSDYMEIKNSLDKQIEIGYEENIYYYYVVYMTDGNKINCLMDYEDTTVCGQPLYEYGDNEYTQVFVTGEEYFVREISSYGSWMFILLPIWDDNGNVIAELEVGASLDGMVQEKHELIRENIIAVICSCSVFIMLILEGIFALSFYEKRKGTSKEMRDITQQMPIRTIVFLAYMTDSMQDVFIALLCSRLYTEYLPISRELAIALPMSMQLLMTAVFSMFGGRFAEKFGVRKLIRIGLISQMTGFLICVLLPGYMGILIGKIFIGIGLGTVYVTTSTMASLGSDDDYVENGFADVSAGVLSGVTIGGGLGSIILSIADYRMVYVIGAILLGSGLLLTISAKNVTFKGNTKDACIKQIGKFLCKRHIVAFFALILVPFMISLSYREYFFPLYVEKFGMNEVQIGRIYLCCGFFVLYIGPYLSKCILRVFGAGKSIIFASFCMALTMAIFAIVPNLYTVILGMVMLGFVISFAYTCQYTYYERLQECSMIGMGNAMGIYSMFESIGQTLGPIVYGSALMFGERNGIGLLFTIMFVFVCFFWKFGLNREK